jgi:fucose 4-O-acetylase-like acetyltransferase
MIQRNNSIDALKAFTITLVVIGHVIQYSKIDFDKDILFKYIYSFHMPLFIFISGYVTYKDNDAYKGFVRNKLHSLIIPYFSWLFLSSVISAIKNNSNVFFNIKRILVYPDYGLWFLWVLFFMHIVLYIQVKYFNKYFIAFMSTLSISFLGLSYVFKFDNLLSFKMFSFLFPFYIVGYFCNKQKSYIVGLIKKWYLFSPFFIFLEFFGIEMMQ